MVFMQGMIGEEPMRIMSSVLVSWLVCAGTSIFADNWRNHLEEVTHGNHKPCCFCLVLKMDMWRTSIGG